MRLPRLLPSIPENGVTQSVSSHIPAKEQTKAKSVHLPRLGRDRPGATPNVRGYGPVPVAPRAWQGTQDGNTYIPIAMKPRYHSRGHPRHSRRARRRHHLKPGSAAVRGPGPPAVSPEPTAASPGLESGRVSAIRRAVSVSRSVESGSPDRRRAHWDRREQQIGEDRRQLEREMYSLTTILAKHGLNTKALPRGYGGRPVYKTMDSSSLHDRLSMRPSLRTRLGAPSGYTTAPTMADLHEEELARLATVGLATIPFGDLPKALRLQLQRMAFRTKGPPPILGGDRALLTHYVEYGNKPAPQRAVAAAPEAPAAPPAADPADDKDADKPLMARGAHIPIYYTTDAVPDVSKHKNDLAYRMHYIRKDLRHINDTLKKHRISVERKLTMAVGGTNHPLLGLPAIGSHRLFAPGNAVQRIRRFTPPLEVLVEAQKRFNTPDKPLFGRWK